MSEFRGRAKGYFESYFTRKDEAIANVFQLALGRNPENAGFNPLALWDAHYLRELDDSGFIDQLYR
jgi:hypothetical protein